MKKFLWSFLEIFETVAIAVVAVFLIRTFIAQPFLVSGASMEPNFYDGDYLLVDELTYRFRKPERGEVIIFRYPQESSSYFIKRIIGLPGEKVVIEDGVVKIITGNETKILDEVYVLRKGEIDYFEKTLASNEYFVMGDNRNFSFDSRTWGPLPETNIIGLVRLRLWPLTQVMAFSAPVY